MKEITSFAGELFKTKDETGEKLPEPKKVPILFSLVKNADSPSGKGFVKAEFDDKQMKIEGLFYSKKIEGMAGKVSISSLHGLSTKDIVDMKDDVHGVGMFMKDLSNPEQQDKELKVLITWETMLDLHLFKQAHATKKIGSWLQDEIHDDRVLCVYESESEIPLRTKKGYGKSFRIHENAFGLNACGACYKYEETSDKMQAEAKKAKQTRETRKAAKALGGKALKGTAKQKSWAEEIRKSFLTKVNTEQADLVLNADIAQSAKFWIETRTASTNQIIDVIKNPNTYDDLIKELKEKEREAKLAEVRASAERRYRR